MDAEQHHAGHINAQRRLGKRQQRGIRGEHGDENLREEHDCSPQQGGIAQAGFQQELEGRLHPIRVARPVVVADDGLRALAEALQRQHGELHHAGQYGHGAHRDVAAVPQQGGVEADGNDAFAGLHNEGG